MAVATTRPHPALAHASIPRITALCVAVSAGEQKEMKKFQVVSVQFQAKTKKQRIHLLFRTWNRMFQGRTGTAIPSHMKKRLLF
jgi:hypothetical protein